jgi:radical SAM superfamily enzyme YgiQ (UPF0313 family)
MAGSRAKRNCALNKQVILISPLPQYEAMRGFVPSLPLGLLYLAESLIQHGYIPIIIQEENEKAIKKIDETVCNETICFGMSTMSGTQLANAINIATHLKRKYPNISIVWGGVHPTAIPEQTLQSDLVDVVVAGEGEKIFIEVLEALPQLKKYIAQNGYTDIGRTFHLPYKLLDMHRYARELLIGPKHEYQIWTSRGCPFKCKFCSNSSEAWPNTKVRYHTLNHILNDVTTLWAHGADCITFADEMFLLDEDRFLSILSMLNSYNDECKYRFWARVDLLLRLHPATWREMKDRGVIAIGTAPESGSQRMLDYMGKGITVDQIYKVNDLLSKYGFYKSFNFLICTPRETKKDLAETVEMARNLVADSGYSPYPIGTLNKYIPLPGTELYKDAIAHGFKEPEKLEDWRYFDMQGVEDTLHIVRPWIKDYSRIEDAIKQIEEVNKCDTVKSASCQILAQV